MITELNDRYVKLNNTHAKFSDSGFDDFPGYFEIFHKKQDKANFFKFTSDSMIALRKRVENIQSAKGGYLVFADYFEIRDYLGIFLIRNTKGVLFKKDKSIFKINPQVHIDFERMAMACRINKDSYKTKEERYISFINRKNEPTSEYFIKWICAEDRINNRTDTKHLFDILCEIPKPVDENGNQYTKEYFLDSAYEFIKGTPNRNVDLKTFGSHFFNDENAIIEYAEAKNLQINTQFRADSAVLRRFINVKVKADNIELSFPPIMFNNEIKFDKRNSDTIIIKSKNLVDKIKSELVGNGQ